MAERTERADLAAQATPVLGLLLGLGLGLILARDPSVAFLLSLLFFAAPGLARAGAARLRA